MKTFVARFVRKSGAVGVVHIMASSSVCAMLDAVHRVGDVTGLSVRPHRRAALLVPYPQHHGDDASAERASAVRPRASDLAG
jgi:hypothetical protein